MKHSLLIVGALVLTVAAPSVLAQTSPSDSSQPADPAEQLEQTNSDGSTPPQTQPLEIDAQQTDQFFTPAPRPQIIERSTGSGSDDETLVEPPPGSQTPADVTPGQRLNLQIR